MQSDDFDSVGFLLGDAARVLRNRFDEYARAKGVTRQQWMTLLALKRKQPVNQTTLAAYLEVEPISMGRMIDRLVAADLVERRVDSQDRRARVLGLTPTAQDLLQELSLLGAKVMAEAAQGMDPDEIAWFAKALETICANLSGAEAATAG